MASVLCAFYAGISREQWVDKKCSQKRVEKVKGSKGSTIADSVMPIAVHKNLVSQ